MVSHTTSIGEFAVADPSEHSVAATGNISNVAAMAIIFNIM